MDDKRKQVAAQCRAVAHMARTISEVYDDIAKMHESGPGGWDELTEIRGQRTAELLEELGDILNGMDAVTDEDAWVHPILEEAQRRWPTAA